MRPYYQTNYDTHFDIVPIWRCDGCSTVFSGRSAEMNDMMEAHFPVDDYYSKRRLSMALSNNFDVKEALAYQPEMIQMQAKIQEMESEFRQKLEQLVSDTLTSVRQRVKDFTLE